MVRSLAAYVSAVLITAVLGSVSHSLFIQQAFVDATAASGSGVAEAIPMADRIGWITHDLIGLEPLYGGLIAVALFIAFLVAGLVARFTGLRAIVFAVAGAIAMFVMFRIMRMELGTVGVFGARSMMGLGAQMMVGFLGGLLFAMISRQQAES
ncbi:MAG: hypothetical protein ABL973_08305 [Micropepsaceae bacterium]